MDDDVRHKSSSCVITKARRLYIRDYTLHLSLWDSGPKKKQVFIPIGIICLNCGCIIGHVGGRFTLNKKEWDVKFPDYPELPSIPEQPHFNRQQRRRADRRKEKRLKRHAKYGIKDQRKVITHRD